MLDKLMLQNSKQNLIELTGNPAECLILVNLSSSAAAMSLPSLNMHAAASP